MDSEIMQVLLDEALKMMKSSEKMSVSAWIDLMSGKRILPFLLGAYIAGRTL